MTPCSDWTMTESLSPKIPSRMLEESNPLTAAVDSGTGSDEPKVPSRVS